MQEIKAENGRNLVPPCHFNTLFEDWRSPIVCGGCNFIYYFLMNHIGKPGDEMSLISIESVKVTSIVRIGTYFLAKAASRRSSVNIGQWRFNNLLKAFI